MDELVLYGVIFLVVALVKAFQKLLERSAAPRPPGGEGQPPAPRGDPMGEVRKLLEEFVEGAKQEEPPQAPPTPARPPEEAPRPDVPRGARDVVVRPVSAPPSRASQPPRRVGRREAHAMELAAVAPAPRPAVADTVVLAPARPPPAFTPPPRAPGLAALLGRSDLSPAQRAVALSLVLAPRGRWARGRGL